MNRQENRMSKSFAVLIAVTTSIGLSTRDLHAGGSCCSSKSSTPNAAGAGDCHSGNQSVQQREDPPFRAVHGGQLYQGIWNYYEVVYGPRQTRVYLYDMFRHPVPTHGIEGSAIMRVRSTGREYRYPLRHTGVANGQDYLGFNVDLTLVHDGDMDVRFELTNLPNRDQPEVQFTQTFALSGPRPQVTVSQLTEADRPLIQRQGMCPVMDAELGGHGEPVKLMVDGRPLFVCCQGCIGKVEQDPDLYLRKTSPVPQVNYRPPAAPDMAADHSPSASAVPFARQGICPVMDQPLGNHGSPIELSVAGRQMFVCCEDCVREVEQHPDVYLRKMAATNQGDHLAPPQARITVSQATQDDVAAANAQGFCPVMNQPLGGHGPPIKVEIDGRPLYVCCQGCVAKVEANPDLYLAKVVRGQQPDPHGSHHEWSQHQPRQSAAGSGGSCCSSGSGGGSSRSRGGSSCH